MFDGDLVATFSHPAIINNRIEGNPIDYKHGIAQKEELSRENIFQADLDGLGSKIGFITNCSSTSHCMAYNYEEESKERREIDRRLKIFRFLQGQEIDSAKTGGSKFSIPSGWVKYNKEADEIEKEILIDKRPYFTRYLYEHYDRKYLDEVDDANKYCWSRFGRSFSSVLEKPSNSKERKFIENYYKYSFFIHTSSPMNDICRYMEGSLEEIEEKIKKTSFYGDFDYSTLYSKSSPDIDEEKLRTLRKLMEKYLVLNRVWRKSSSSKKKDIFDLLSQLINEAKSISSSSEELGNLSVSLLMETVRSNPFVWNVMGDFIIENILSRHGRTITIPVEDAFGEIEFLYKTYSEKRVVI